MKIVNKYSTWKFYTYMFEINNTFYFKLNSLVVSSINSRDWLYVLMYHKFYMCLEHQHRFKWFQVSKDFNYRQTKRNHAWGSSSYLRTPSIWMWSFHRCQQFSFQQNQKQNKTKQKKTKQKNTWTCKRLGS